MSIVATGEQAMEPPLKRSRMEGNGDNLGERRTHRSASVESRSSTSSGILVASGVPVTAQQHDLTETMSQVISMAIAPVRSVVAELDTVHKRFLTIKAQDKASKDFLRKLKEDDDRRPRISTQSSDSLITVKDEVNDEDQVGPNRRGTYSRQYTLSHPEIEWVHRGQGRYLPASHHSQKSGSSKPDSNPKRNSSSGLQKAIDQLESKQTNRTIPQRRRSLEDDPKTSIFATPKQRLSLRRQFSEAQTASSTDQRTARLSRRAKPTPSTELERRSSRQTNLQNYNESDEDEDMSDSKEPTYDKAYVDAHPGEKFYHTGNGWYKKGSRPKGRKMAKHRESEGQAVVRRRDGSYQFEEGKTIHVSQLQNYPGVEFHHCGNGWYKPGPDSTGNRASRIGAEELAVFDDDDEDQEGPTNEDASVSKEYALLHPDVEWVHRGNGRYKRKSVISGAGTQASDSISPAAERDQTIYSKEYVEAHPNEEFHHRGNARYMRGPPPDHWASVRRKKTGSTAAASTPRPEVEDDDSQLFSKAYVKAHPNEQFYHRGQGRYARGSRPRTVTTEPEDKEDDSEDSIDPDELVDTDYVNSHPNETFHHRGQGRWARGLPPPGSSNKTAVRGPELIDGPDAASLLEGEDETEKPPPLSALVLRAEGPDRWPGISWHYRGGGKWGRLTKQEFEDIQRGVTRRTKGKARARTSNGPEAQLEREAAAAEAVRRRSGNDGSLAGDANGDTFASVEKPKAKRRRINNRGSYQAQEENAASKQSSKSQSQAPTPKPRMLEPEEDILGEEDLPQLYEGDWSPDPDDIEYGSRMPSNLFRPITDPDKFVRAMTKHAPEVRSTETLMALAENTQKALDGLQQEYLALDRITAQHARIPRKPAKGGRVPVDDQIFEDKKEADLYDYAFDARRLGYQDPQAQKIQRDADGRELRNRRQRGAITNNGTLPGWNFGEDEPLGPRRAVKPVSRFDGIVHQPHRRGRNSANATGRTSKAPSMTPDRVTTPLGGPAGIEYAPATSGRWRNHVPKRIRELRGDSAAPPSNSTREMSPGTARKGRPPGSKNLHKRRDAGIKKGPRKPKTDHSVETPLGSDGEEV